MFLFLNFCSSTTHSLPTKPRNLSNSRSILHPRAHSRRVQNVNISRRRISFSHSFITKETFLSEASVGVFSIFNSLLICRFNLNGHNKKPCVFPSIPLPQHFGKNPAATLLISSFTAAFLVVYSWPLRSFSFIGISSYVSCIIMIPPPLL